MDSPKKLSTLTIALHWIIGIGVIMAIASGLYIDGLPRGYDKGALVGAHQSLGILILLLAVLRIVWRLKNGFPVALSAVSRCQEIAGKTIHILLLAGTVLLPISGFIMTVGGGYPVMFFGFELVAGSPEKNEVLSQIGHFVHGVGGYVLIALILLHIAGALKHHFLVKDGTLKRIIGLKF